MHACTAHVSAPVPCTARMPWHYNVWGSLSSRSFAISPWLGPPWPLVYRIWLVVAACLPALGDPGLAWLASCLPLPLPRAHGTPAVPALGQGRRDTTRAPDPASGQPCPVEATQSFHALPTPRCSLSFPSPGT
jgi:hypothetical protein